MNDTRRVIGYVRVSTEGQAESGAGLEVQRQAIELEVARRGWELVAIIADEGVSAKSMNRPGLTEALLMLENGDADGLVCSKLDRLSRSVKDFAELMDMSRYYGWALVVLDLGVDTTTPAGEAMANVMATFAQFERRMIGLRTREALAVKKAEGIQLGRRAAPVDGSALAIIEAKRQSGLSLAKIAQELNEQGIPTPNGAPTWHAMTVSRTLERVAA